MSEFVMPQPPDGDCRILDRGTAVYVLANASSWIIEAMVVAVRKATGARVDWAYVGGRGVISVLGDREDRDRVRSALRNSDLRFVAQELPE